MLQQSAKFERFISQQIAQYERDKQREDNVEIKCVGIDFLSARIEDDELGCDPEVLRFPGRVAEAVAKLGETDLALLTRRYYALSKEGTAQNEMITGTGTCAPSAVPTAPQRLGAMRCDAHLAPELPPRSLGWLGCGRGW